MTCLNELQHEGSIDVMRRPAGFPLVLDTVRSISIAHEGAATATVTISGRSGLLHAYVWLSPLVHAYVWSAMTVKICYLRAW